MMDHGSNHFKARLGIILTGVGTLQLSIISFSSFNLVFFNYLFHCKVFGVFPIIVTLQIKI